MRARTKILLLAMSLSACGPLAMRPSTTRTGSATFENGLQLNGAILNGLELNGLELNGLQLNGLQLNGLQLNGLQLNGLQLNGTSFSAADVNDPSHIVSGTALVGTTFDITMTSGNNPGDVKLRIDDIQTDQASASGDVLLYAVSYQNAGSSTWTPICRDADGNAVASIPLSNYWNMTTGARVDDPNATTFACVNAALGKCVRWGYRPWATATRCVGTNCPTVSLKDYHQACTRMVRADYCGNGQPHTLDGTQIDVFDNLSPQIQSRATTWKLEARWTPSGATCLGNTRQEDLFQKNRSRRFRNPNDLAALSCNKGPSKWR